MDNVPLNNLEASICKVLDNHRGKNEAIKKVDLVAEVNRIEYIEHHERDIRATVKHLMESHGVWIGSCSKGYYLITTYPELHEACSYYRSYAMSLLHTESMLLKISLPGLLGQTKIKF